MTILQDIKAKYLQARKEKNAPQIGFLSVLLSDAQMIGKNNGNRESTDAEVITVIKKMIAGATDTIGYLITAQEPDPSQIEGLRHEVEILESFLPKQLSEEELTGEIVRLIDLYQVVNIKGMGKIMSELKKLHSGKYDGATASKIFKEKIS